MASSQGRESNGQIERGQRALADDYRMNEFDRDVLRIGRIGPSSERKQAAALEKALGHVAAGECEAAAPRVEKNVSE